jgi:hypothetical protein
MKNNLNKYDKYLGERVKITDHLGDTFYIRVMGNDQDYIKGFDDERLNRKVRVTSIKNVEVVGK